MTRLVITCATLLALASCGTPQERCEQQVSSEYRQVSRLLNEVNQNLARGYAWDDGARRSNVSFCAGGFRSRGWGGGIGFGYGTCYDLDSPRRRVPIDPVSEMRKRDALQQRLAALSQRGPATCMARYGTAAATGG